MKKVRFGIVGTGGMGQGHCSKMQDLDEVKLTCVCDIDEDKVKGVGKQYGVPHFLKHKDLLESGLADAVIVATPHYFHPPIAIDAFRKGIHVLSEKPIGVTVKAVDRMIKAAEKSGLIFSVMFQWRSEPSFQAAKRLIDAGRVGEIYRTELMMGSFRSQAYYDSATWRATWRGEGGGVLLNQAPHIMDIFTWLAGVPKTVRGKVNTRRHEIEVEDEAYALLEYANGATGYIHCSVNEVPGTNRIEICGEKGKILLDGRKLSFHEVERGIQEYSDGTEKMWGSPEASKKRVPLKKQETGHAAIIRNTARAILYGEELLSPGIEGIRSLELANAMILSGNKGKIARIPLDRDEYEDLINQLKKKSKTKKRVRLQTVTDPQHK